MSPLGTGYFQECPVSSYWILVAPLSLVLASPRDFVVVFAEERQLPGPLVGGVDVPVLLFMRWVVEHPSRSQWNLELVKLGQHGDKTITFFRGKVCRGVSIGTQSSPILEFSNKKRFTQFPHGSDNLIKPLKTTEPSRLLATGESIVKVNADEVNRIGIHSVEQEPEVLWRVYGP